MVLDILESLKIHRHVPMGAQVVDLIGLHLLNDPDQVGAVREIPVVEHQERVALMGVLIQVIDPAGVEAAGPPQSALKH
jgi:hypothetical protein